MFNVLHIVSLLASILAKVFTIWLASTVEIIGTGIVPALIGVDGDLLVLEVFIDLPVWLLRR